MALDPIDLGQNLSAEHDFTQKRHRLKDYLRARDGIAVSQTGGW
ncbi:hypothetical protein [Sinorhizobium meliloti]